MDSDYLDGWNAGSLRADANIETLERERDALVEAIEQIDEAYCGLMQTQLAASSVGLELAKSLHDEGYGLNLRLAIRAALNLKGGGDGQPLTE